MHIAPVVFVAHDAGPDGWVDTLSRVADLLDAHPDLPLTMRVPGAAIQHLSRTDPESWGRLTLDGVMWLAGGWSDPVLSHLPPRAQALQLSRERAAMETAGVSPGGLWVGDAWEPGLIRLAVESELSLVAVDASLLDEPSLGPGPVDRAGDTVLVVPVVDAVSAQEGDGLTVVRVQPDQVEPLAASHRGCLITPERYLEDHLPGDPLSIRVTEPGRTPDAEPFYRQLLAVSADRTERSGGVDRLLSLQSRRFTTGPGGDEAAHRRLIDARKDIDRATHRGDSWVEVREVDWDADGMAELHIETAVSTLIVDSTDATLDVWDDKVDVWPILAVTPATGGVLMRHMTEDGMEPPVGPMHVDRRTEGRAEADVTLAGEDGKRCRVTIAGRVLTIELTMPSTAPLRVGPEIPVLLDVGSTSVRVDGGDWIDADEPLALSGHRFRLRDDGRTMLVSTTRPAEFFVRPLAGHGLVVWPHWPTAGDATYGVSFTPS